jgi:hypothetical protein
LQNASSFYSFQQSFCNTFGLYFCIGVEDRLDERERERERARREWEGLVAGLNLDSHLLLHVIRLPISPFFLNIFSKSKELINSKDKLYYWKADSRLCSQGTHCHLWNSKLHCCGQKILPLVAILSQINKIHIFTHTHCPTLLATLVSSSHLVMGLPVVCYLQFLRLKCCIISRLSLAFCMHRSFKLGFSPGFVGIKKNTLTTEGCFKTRGGGVQFAALA